MRRTSFAALAACLALASCSSSPNEAAPISPNPSPTSTGGASSLSSEPSSDPQSLLDFEEVLASSCLKALEEGVEESSEDFAFSLLLFPEEYSIDGFSAVQYDMQTEDVSLVWETDAFYVCYFSNQIGLAQEFGDSVSMSFQATANGFGIVDETFGEPYSYQLEIQNDSVVSVDDGNSVWKIRYGIGQDQLALLERAVAEFLD